MLFEETEKLMSQLSELTEQNDELRRENIDKQEEVTSSR